MSYLLSCRTKFPALLVVAALCLGAMVLPFLPMGGALGAYMASRDVSRGNYLYSTLCTNSAWEREWKRTMHCEYGIQIRSQPLRDFSFALRETYDEAYNRAQLAGIEAHFGSNVIFATRDHIRQAFGAKTARVN